MKTLSILLLLVLFACFAVSVQAQTLSPAPAVQPPRAAGAGGCTKCSASQSAGNAALQTPVLRPIPGTNENIPVGQIENVIPIGVLTVLGCETCSVKAVNWALQQGSSFEEIERALRMVETMQKLDCFKEQFGPDVAGRLEKPLAAARAALAEARLRAAK